MIFIVKIRGHIVLIDVQLLNDLRGVAVRAQMWLAFVHSISSQSYHCVMTEQTQVSLLHNDLTHNLKKKKVFFRHVKITNI